MKLVLLHTLISENKPAEYHRASCAPDGRLDARQHWRPSTVSSESTWFEKNSDFFMPQKTIPPGKNVGKRECADLVIGPKKEKHSQKNQHFSRIVVKDENFSNWFCWFRANFNQDNETGLTTQREQSQAYPCGFHGSRNLWRQSCQCLDTACILESWVPTSAHQTTTVIACDTELRLVSSFLFVFLCKTLHSLFLTSRMKCDLPRRSWCCRCLSLGSRRTSTWQEEVLSYHLPCSSLSHRCLAIAQSRLFWLSFVYLPCRKETAIIFFLTIVTNSFWTLPSFRQLE